MIQNPFHTPALQEYPTSRTGTSLIALTLAALALASPNAFAAKADRSKPIEVSANEKITDYKNGTSVYTGQVVIDQGSLHATGDKATLYVKNGQLVRAELDGKPATFQELDEKNQLVKGSATHATYLATEQKIVLTGNAQLNRQGDRLAAQRITYNMKDEVVQAGGPDNGGRVHVTIQPRNKKENPSSTDDTPSGNTSTQSVKP
ncbi:lipopolysaccharide transport periplasmic protein LptA [Halothiobacillus diazotrophicus]|uniref:Lipopolysaccharide export system protein LptA n=1 Tax=Halothiobacillus diazotrophicus TaxID=1860122 RepID=A0A191ZE62_9GAMM|nr:lipopolysaccharide transport periplasmic protein LptA [Halothiobacillus diazotrophicus]ANJ66158.1 lipopolysaccharide transport periplasmic protein LptA [Halothiobacillus diazotrophicus]